MFFEGFELRYVPVGTGRVRVRVGGEGPPVLLLHGHPQTHAMWHLVAPRLAEAGHTVVAADLRGYGESVPPAVAGERHPYSKRAMAAELVAVMRTLGHEEFAVAGHDRGGRVAYRMALDHPETVTRLAVLDIVPTSETWAFADRHGRAFGRAFPHWFYLAEPGDRLERLVSADPDSWYYLKETEQFHPDALADYRRCLHRPSTVHAIFEDYRAGAGIDDLLDRADRASGRRIACPVLSLWSARGELPGWFNVRAVWRRWADQVSGYGIDCGHYLAEEAPDETASALTQFLAEEPI
ncbi:alpha/beta hydrolase [Phytomonospora sp. NPDC050363]|uniref:alpha/beta fold hydrolase n=1 Tax=Phytomonospora sp. NPDC050363 TaxID=3155642 RepID=UPI0033CBF173